MGVAQSDDMIEALDPIWAPAERIDGRESTLEMKAV
jgi:hypothetical protein